MKYYLRLFFILCVVLIPSVFLVHAYTDSDPSTVLELQIPCNGNGICEANFGETIINCPADCPVAPTPGPDTTPFPGGASHPGGMIPLTIDSITITQEAGTAIVSWTTSVPALSSFTWGKTADYEVGTLSEISYSTEHRVKLVDLPPSTYYFFSIQATDTVGRKKAASGSFITPRESSISGPPNVENAKFSYEPTAIVLTWENPDISDLETIRILRSTVHYPRDPQEGHVVYEAGGQYLRDTDVTKGDYYYSIFVKNTRGQYSSGVGLRVPFPQSTTGSSTNNIPGFPDYTNQPNYLKNVSLADFDFIQLNKKVSFTDGVVSIVADAKVTVQIKNLIWPNFRRAIVIHVQDSLNTRSYTSYILKFDKERNLYEGIVDEFGEGGAYPFTISIVDEDNKALKLLNGSFIVKGRAVIDQVETLKRFFIPVDLLIIILLIIAFVIIWITNRQKPQKSA